ncbi:hypothetical protein J2T56_002451 [Natronobacillus azotifigens]|uniref:Uncharacterized protein n=1 Tax=Natronobacillus azotifigens TaxID=472978 RepID=A0A9J6RFG9_9BACI|nr:hypothetical protein [Natronobacillus azotifigens]MCZ0704158.1 hypothetical protein [Natronobacillus azotifigens]
MSYKKNILKISIGLVFGFLLYLAIHLYVNQQVINTYASGFGKNPLDDYVKSESNLILSVYDAPLFQTYTNLAIHNSKEKVDLIIWVPLYSKSLSYGLVVTDDKNEISYQIDVNEHLETEDDDYKELLKTKQTAINEIKSIAKKEWGLEF